MTLDNNHREIFDISFKDIHNDSEIHCENDRFIHYHTPSQLIKYYANYYEYKLMPTYVQFLEDYHEQKKFHEKHNQKHALFIFPERAVLDKKIQESAQSFGFSVEKMELYLLQRMPTSRETDIEVVQVLRDDDVFMDFLEVCREGELEYGEEFADLKATTHRRDLLDDKVLQFVGYKHGFPAGKVEVVESNEYVELDDFYVLDAMRKQGVGTALQQSVWKYAEQVGKRVILIADGNDSPREMYQKQGYVLISERYELLKAPSI